MTHTWPLYVHYHRCPSCGYIIESRKDYVYEMGKWIKDVTCNRCKNAFRLEGKAPPIGPLMGEAPKPEFNWSE